MVSFVITSCLDDDNNIEYSPDATIHAFALDTAGLGSYKFTIDQLSCEIYNEDSLPVHADTIIDKILIKTLTTASGVVTMKDKSGNDSVLNINDSIDLRKELILRSDNKKVGGIKKERKAMVPPMFLKIFMSSYREYMKHIEGRKYEAEYGPLNINRDGKCMTYAAYYTSFKTIVAKEIVPELLNSNDPELENGISPHIFRHWYTVQLVLAGVETVNELMSWRGDKSPESALTYLNDKGELMRKYKRVQGETFNYLSWLAEKRHG